MGSKRFLAHDRYLMIIAFILKIAFLILFNTDSSYISPIPSSDKVASNINFRNEIPQRVIVNSVHIDLPIRSSPFENGSWIAHDDSASYAKGTSPLNSDDGNTLIFGHARSKLFKPLLNAKLGDTIKVYSNSEIYFYKIVDRQVVSPYNVNALESPAKYKITLLTCIGKNDENRLLLRGELIGLNKEISKEVI